ncbi:DUF1998 domain-containing protein [Modestobacter muralis]|uniref:DUF1998 domain-containing protein n=1 Tax=Modestobacter muralis TaxID=1608614 RepID=A0A6P0ELX9_9ACTN|nr:DUF1998 domain-containing protein [Modestobacter muralis]NEK92711.1 DUF1998 domain-containing protein [Modestobacter muralis]NEN49478.1 DUF1998 domain-containing protein [Modestobacter muralis]
MTTVSDDATGVSDLSGASPEPVLASVEQELDPIADVEDNKPKNRAKVGAVRPSALLYTQGIGSTVDLPHLSVMPHGLDDWERIYRRRPTPPETIVEPRLLQVVQAHLGKTVQELRKPPWASAEIGQQNSATDLGIPGRIFPQWLRCTGCGLLGQVSDGVSFEYRNTNPFRPDKAEFVHVKCSGWSEEGATKRKPRDRTAVPARYLIACQKGHLDEFPYVAWVHRGEKCPAAARPRLRMQEWKSNLGPDVRMTCQACKQKRGMLEATARGADTKLPRCRGRHPHLDAFFKCQEQGRLMLLGAANQWFSNTVSALSLPREDQASASELAPAIKSLPKPVLQAIHGPEGMDSLKLLAGMNGLAGLEDVENVVLWDAFQIATGQAIEEAHTDQAAARRDPQTLLAPEWTVLSDRSKFTKYSGSSDFKAASRKVAEELEPLVTGVVAVERLKKVNAFIGFTRIDAFDRIDDASDRVAPLTRTGAPAWVPATEDRGEGVFLQFDEERVAAWEADVLVRPVWQRYREAHRLNFLRRTSKTAAEINPDGRFPSPRYWAIHTLSHLLIREMAMSSGYGSASLTERIFAWPENGDVPPAAGLLISTTSSDSEGTLGGLVELAKPEKLRAVVLSALGRGTRCSSDPICSHRAPRGKEDFLHGAACHFCLFVSETSCERTNRFLDRRMVFDLVADDSVATPGLFSVLLPDGAW